jgi:hypothetical protein
MTDLKNLKVVSSFNYDLYDGVKSSIDSVELQPRETKDFGKGNVEVQQVIVTTKNLAKKGKEVIAKEYISLKLDSETNEFGIPDGADSIAQKFLKYFKVSNLTELEGKECMVVKRVKERKGKESTLLGIHHG